jgi:uncharacterized protein (UPF0264 family)
MLDLLVSVRSPEEALAALAGGADIIDVKEPNAGALGAANAKVWRAVAKAIEERVPLSASLGELLEFPSRLAESSLASYQYAKMGLAHCTEHEDWKALWKAALAQIPKNIHRVAVAYADYATAKSPLPAEIIHTAKQNRCKVFMLDTYDKTKLDVFDVMPGREIKRLFDLARENGMVAVLAGGLRLGRIAEALEVMPNVIAVRGGVCSSTRTGELSQDLVALWKRRCSHRQRGPRPHISFADK